MTHDNRLAQIESDVRGFVKASYPNIVVRAEYWTPDPTRVALFFIDEQFAELYPRQRYHYLVHLIPKDYYDSFLADAVWFELTPGQRDEDVQVDPDEDFIESITADVLHSLQARRFFAALDDVFCPTNSITSGQVCSGDFRNAKRTLQHCGFEESDWSDVFHVLMGQGGFCDCEILYNVVTESRLKSQYWQRRGHQTRS